MDTGDRLLTPAEVASVFRVDPKTVARWASKGRIASIRLPNRHRRYRESSVRKLLEEEPGGQPVDALLPAPPPQLAGSPHR